MSISKKFSVYSLIFIFLTGAVTWLVVQKEVRGQVFREYEHDAMMAQRNMLHHLKASDFQPGDKRLEGRAFEEFMNDSMSGNHFDFIRIWRPNGQIIYSNDRSIVGKKLKVKETLVQALSGQVVTRVIEPLDVGHDVAMKGQKKAPYLEIYTPIEMNGKVVGVFETYSDLMAVYERTEKINTSIVAVICVSLVLLWFALSRIVRQAARTIDTQNVGLRRLADERADSLGELEENFLGTLRSLATAVEARCSYTSGHSQRTRYLSLQIARRLGVPDWELGHLGPAATLHDIGKIGTPEAILEKKTALTTDEWEKMKEHPEVGAQIVSAVPFLAHLAPIIRGHHENFDGTGYPDGLEGEQIPLEARILAVADAFDAITSNRPYRAGVTIDEALIRLKQDSGVRFDPGILGAFIGLCRDDHLRQGEIRRLYGPQYANQRLVSVKNHS